MDYVFVAVHLKQVTFVKCKLNIIPFLIFCLCLCVSILFPYFSLFRFRPMSVFHEGDGDESGFTCCAFSACERFLILGTCYGHLKFYNVFSGEEEANYTCHSSAITHLEPSRVC